MVEICVFVLVNSQIKLDLSVGSTRREIDRSSAKGFESREGFISPFRGPAENADLDLDYVFLVFD